MTEEKDKVFCEKCIHYDSFWAESSASCQHPENMDIEIKENWLAHRKITTFLMHPSKRNASNKCPLFKEEKREQ